MQVTFLGTGTSMGVPMIGCECEVCKSTDPKDKRTRSSVWIEADGLNLIIDTGIDFRQQALREGIKTLDAVLFTHPHADHILGLDDVRPINFSQKKALPVYADAHTDDHLHKIFDYAFRNKMPHADLPRLKSRIFDENPFKIENVEVTPIPLIHGDSRIFGFRIRNFAYCTDVSEIPPESYPLLQGLDCLVLGALRNRPHFKHFTIEEAVNQARKIKARETYFVHMSHEVSHRNLLKILPYSIQPAYDGLKLKFD